MFERLSYFGKRSLKNIAAHKLMSTVSVSIVAASLVLLGIFIIIGTNVTVVLDKLGDCREINVYISKDAAGRPIADIESELKLLDGISSVKFYSREDRLAKVTKEVYGEGGYSFGVGENPLRDSYIITVSDAAEVDNIAKAAQEISGVEETVHSSDVINGIDAFARGVRAIVIWLAAVLLLIAVFITANTAKIGMSAYGDEIKIMRMVGATDGFITAPFVIQAIFLGIIGAALASIICLLGYALTADRAVAMMPGYLAAFVSVGKVAEAIMPTFFIVGIVIGVLGSIAAVKRYLK